MLAEGFSCVGYHERLGCWDEISCTLAEVSYIAEGFGMNVQVKTLAALMECPIGHLGSVHFLYCNMCCTHGNMCCYIRRLHTLKG